MNKEDVLQITSAVEKVVDIKLQPIHKELSFMKNGLTALDVKMDKGFAEVNERLDVLEEKHEILHKEVGRIYARVEQHAKQLKTS